MTLAEYKKLYKKYNTGTWHYKDLHNNPEYEAYIAATNENKEISDWYYSDKAREAGIDPQKYCCAEMAYRLIAAKNEREQLKTDPEYIDYDAVITYDKSHKQFGIPLHDGGASYIAIHYCPWCGTQLKK